MHSETLYRKTKQVLDKISDQKFLKDFYLAGGTALALQLGHRKSIDLDFFTQTNINTQSLLAQLANFKPKVTQESEGTLDVLIDEVKVSFLKYQYPLIEDFSSFSGLDLASIIDIACMKITAVSSRGSRKDFVDLYFILKQYTLSQIFESLEKKFEGTSYSKLHLLKSITYFLDAEEDPDVDYLVPVSWKDIKNELLRVVAEFLPNNSQLNN